MSDHTDKKIFEYTIAVTPDHLDEQQHVNNVVYVQFMQDVAGKHWRSVVSTDLEDEVIWVVRRHEIDYINQAFLHDELMVRTWTGERGTASWIRHYEIIRMTDQKKIITAQSVWVLLDKHTGKPKRITEEIFHRFD